MSALLYIIRKTFKNRIKQSLRKKVTYLYLLIIIGYFAMMFIGYSSLFENMAGEAAGPINFVYLSSFVCVWLLPVGLITYAKRKGIAFKNADVHFVFPAPIAPKTVLLFAQLKSSLFGIVFGLAFAIYGIFGFHIAVWRILIYILFYSVAENILESSLMVILYGNETFSDRIIKIFRGILYAILIVFLLFSLYLWRVEGLSLSILTTFFNHPILQFIPIMGWNIAAIRLVILGPTIINIINTIIYVLAVVLLFIAAKKMKCTGEYYEEAMKFADDYQQILDKSKSSGGQSIQFVGQKKKYKKQGNIVYKGFYGKALFYRQLLEYKKERFFIFGFRTLVDIAVGIGLIYFIKSLGAEVLEYVILFPMGVGAYMAFLGNGIGGKWSKELTKPYTFLIPESPLKKLWYATLIDYIRSFISGSILTLPIGIYFKVSPLLIFLAILVYVCLQIGNMYINIMLETIIGNLLGQMGKSFFKMIFQGIVIGISILIAVVNITIFGMEVGFLSMIACMFVFTFLLALVGSQAFKKMDILE